jgi:hypothetical protein
MPRCALSRQRLNQSFPRGFYGGFRWHFARFKLYWKWISRKRVRAGRKPASKELRELIFHVVAENPIRRGRSLTAAE